MYLGNKPGLGQTGIADLAPDVLDALKSAFYGTPPQFDSDLSLATTEFVQRALGSMSGLVAFSASQVLDASQIGKSVIFQGRTAAATCTLPDPASIAIGGGILVINRDTYPLVIATPAGTIGLPNGTPAASYTIGYGETAYLVSFGTGWTGSGGSGFTRLEAQFGASLAASGYQKLPSGLIIQWGLTAAMATGANIVHALPVTFPNAQLQGFATYNNAGGDTGVGSVYVAQIRAIGLASMTVRNLGPAAAQYSILAIGY